ncbi:helix-turn-helix transcriptional regulator [Megamonas funiformis]|nr:helix-turn-helix transcriptional regulator [Megamonas funiformis]
MIFSKNLKLLLDRNNISQVELSKILGVSESSVGKWLLQKSMPRMNIIEKLAQYFQVDTTYFFKETDKNSLKLTARDERDIKKHLDKALENLENDEALMFDGEPVEMDEETKELLKASLETSIRLAKTLAKKKYTPKKYQKNDKSDD